MHIEHHMQRAMKKYRKLHPDDPFPTITPHVLRHTFCTNMANAGMAIKDLQYLMGHSDADVTLNVYTHASYAHAESAMWKILQFQPNGKPQKFGCGYTKFTPTGRRTVKKYNGLYTNGILKNETF